MVLEIAERVVYLKDGVVVDDVRRARTV
jgi:hypothetical protein